MANLTLSRFSTEWVYLKRLIGHAAETTIEYTELNTDPQSRQAHTDALAEKLLQTTIDYLAASISLDAIPGQD